MRSFSASKHFLPSACCSSGSASIDFVLAFVDAGVAVELGVFLACSRASVSSTRTALLDGGSEGGVQNGSNELALLLAAQRHQLADARGDLLAAVVTEFDGGQDFGFTHLEGAGFDHHDTFFGTGDDDIQLGDLGFFVGGIGDQLAVNHDRRERRRGRGRTGYRKWRGQHRHRRIASDWGSRLGSAEQHERDDLRLVGVAFGE